MKKKKLTFSGSLPTSMPVPLPCGCVRGEFQCAEYQRINALKIDAYYRSDWAEYEKYRKLLWEHIGIPDGGVPVKVEEQQK